MNEQSHPLIKELEKTAIMRRYLHPRSSDDVDADVDFGVRVYETWNEISRILENKEEVSPFLEGKVSALKEEIKTLLQHMGPSPKRLLFEDCAAAKFHEKEYRTLGHCVLVLGNSRLSIESGSSIRIPSSEIERIDDVQLVIGDLLLTLHRDDFPPEGFSIVPDGDAPTWDEPKEGAGGSGVNPFPEV